MAVLLAGVVLLLALTVYPFQYGPVESVVLAVALVVLGLYELVLDSAFEGEG